MKICVTGRGPDLASQVDPRFGRAGFFIIYDDEETFEVVDNSENKQVSGGAGIQAATTVAEKECDWAVSGHMGPEALSVLGCRSQRGHGASGKVSDALRAFREGELEQIEEADASPHW